MAIYESCHDGLVNQVCQINNPEPASCDHPILHSPPCPHLPHHLRGLLQPHPEGDDPHLAPNGEANFAGCGEPCGDQLSLLLHHQLWRAQGPPDEKKFRFFPSCIIFHCLAAGFFIVLGSPMVVCLLVWDTCKGAKSVFLAFGNEDMIEYDKVSDDAESWVQFTSKTPFWTLQNHIENRTSIALKSPQQQQLCHIKLDYSWPHLVWPRTEELFSRRFVDQNEIWLVFRNRRVP